MNLRNLQSKTFLATLLSFTLFFFMSATLVLAQGTNPGQGGGTNTGQGGGSNPISIDNPFNCGGADPCTLFNLLQAIVDNIIMPIGVVLAVLAFIYTGFLFVTAQGNDSKLKSAKTALMNTVIGTAVLLGAWSIATVVRNTVNQLMN